MSKDTYKVTLIKPQREGIGGGAKIVMVIVANSAVDAINKIDRYTGTYQCSYALAEVFEGQIYPLERT